MKATVKTIGRMYHVIGLNEAERELSADNCKPTYEMVYCYNGGAYKTKKHAVDAIKRHGYEYIPETEINTVCGLN
jgi:hypothetical protein